MTPKRQNWYAEIAVAILVIALVILGYFLVRQYRIAARQAQVASERTHVADLTRHRSLGADDIGLIDSWMTFDYVSVSFQVPAAYLSSALKAAPAVPGYPNITLGRYARTVATSSDAVIGSVRDAVRSYLAPQKIPSSTAMPQPE